MRDFSRVLVLLNILLPLANGWAQGEKAPQKTKEATPQEKKAAAAPAKPAPGAEKAKPQETPGQKEKEGREALIREALELAGVKKQMQQIPAMVRAQITKRQGETDPKVHAAISKILTESYQAEEIYQAVENSFKYHFDQKRLTTVLEWLRSPLGRKISELELRTIDPERVQELQKFAAQLKEKPAAKEHMTLVRRLDDATGATQLTLQMNLAGLRSSVKAIDAILPPAKRLQEGQLEKLVNEMKAQLQGPLREGTLTNFLFTYRSLSDPELRRYVEYAESDHGRWFHRVLTEGFLQAMTAAGEKAFQQIVKVKAAEPDFLTLPTKKQEQLGMPRYSPVGKTDPFRPWGLKALTSSRPRESLSPLERYELGQLKLVAIIWKTKEPKAMVEDGAGLGYILKVGTPIGPNEGKIKAIRQGEVVIEESYIDFYGARKRREINMKLNP